MTSTELLAKIKAEIERRTKELDEQIVDIYDSKAVLRKDELQKLLSFLDALEKSLPAKVTDGDVLEEEINRTYHDGSVADTSDIEHVTYENIAEHFYDLGCRRTAEKYDELEYNRQRASGSSEIPKDLLDAQVEIAEKLIGENNNNGANAAHPFACEYVVELLQKAVSAGAKWQADHAPLPEDTALFYKGLEEGKRLMMEEMSECFAQLKQVQSESINMSAVREQLAYNRGAADERYKMRKKMMEDAVEIGTTEICWEQDGERAFPTFDPPVEDLLMPGIISQRFNEGDKVRIIIVKED